MSLGIRCRLIGGQRWTPDLCSKDVIIRVPFTPRSWRYTRSESTQKKSIYSNSIEMTVITQTTTGVLRWNNDHMATSSVLV